MLTPPPSFRSSRPDCNLCIFAQIEKKTHLCEKKMNMLKIKLVNYLHQRSSKCYRRYRFAMALLWSMDVYGLLVELTFAAVPLRGGGCVGGGLATAQRRNGSKSK